MTLILDADDLVGVLDYPTAIDAVEGAFRDVGSGKVVMPVRLTIRVEADEGVSPFMPACLPEKDQLGIKVVSAFGRNREKFGLPTVIGSILLLDAKSGMSMAIVDGSYVTAVRTAAASAVATKYMARGRRVDAGDLRFSGPGGDPPPSDLRGAKVRRVSRKLARFEEVRGFLRE